MQRRVILFLVFIVLNLVAFSQVRNLEYYLEKGLSNSPVLNDYRNQALSAEYDSMLARSAQKPAVEGNSMLQYSPYGRNFGYDEVITDGGNYSALVGVKQSIFNGKILENSYKAASIQRLSALNSSKVTDIELKKLIVSQYLTAFSGYTDLSYNKTFLDLFRKETEIVAQFVKSGIAKQSDYLSLVIETRTQELLVKELQNQYRKDLMLLNSICGLNDSAIYDLTLPSIEVNGTKNINNDPAFMKFRIDSMKIENEMQSIDLRYRPAVKWFADAGMMTSNPWNFYRHFGVSAGLSLNVPIYDGNQKNIEKGKLAFQENSRQAYRNTYINQYNLQITELEKELQTIDELEKGLDEQVRTSAQLMNALKSQLDAGIIEMTEYINSVRSLRSSGRDLNMIKIQRMQIINELNFLLTH
jgi:outer membrane protein TolC